MHLFIQAVMWLNNVLMVYKIVSKFAMSDGIETILIFNFVLFPEDDFVGLYFERDVVVSSSSHA